MGTSTLGAEIAAARLMAPFFGASTIVWANTIAVVLVALSVGYWFGGRMADRRPDLRSLCLLVLVAGVLLGLVPIVAQPFLSLSVKAFDDVSLGAGFGSLLGVLALVAIPVLMLGAVSPWAIRLKLERIEDSGETAGRMYAISTVGSLLGTFLSALLLIPLVGTQRTFLVFALALAVVATLGLGRRWVLVPLGVAALLALPIGTVKASGEGRVIHETDTEYQYARVIDHANGERTLELNEGQAIHSLYRPHTVLTGGYWDGFLVAPFAVRRDAPRRVAMLGFAGGTVARAYARYFPAARIDGVEIDRELFDIGRRYFGLRARPQLHEYGEDARPFLRRIDARYDVIYLDTYRQPYIPFYLSTREFFKLACDRLAPGGLVVVNLGHPEGSDTLEKVLSATMGTAFTHVARDPMEPTNTILMASQAPVTRANLVAASRTLPGDLRPLAAASAARLAPRLRGGAVYTDDKAPVEWLVDKSIVEYAAGGGG
ncbi:MAG: fused MFS/spermidine synthase [Solirubrobacteraceae bacterium]